MVAGVAQSWWACTDHCNGLIVSKKLVSIANRAPQADRNLRDAPDRPGLFVRLTPMSYSDELQRPTDQTRATSRFQIQARARVLT